MGWHRQNFIDPELPRGVANGGVGLDEALTANPLRRSLRIHEKSLWASRHTEPWLIISGKHGRLGMPKSRIGASDFVVVDVSVVRKWLAEGKFSDRAAALTRFWDDEGILVAGPFPMSYDLHRCLVWGGLTVEVEAYDDHGLDMAETRGCEFWIANQGFCRAASLSVDPERWIGALSVPEWWLAPVVISIVDALKFPSPSLSTEELCLPCSRLAFFADHSYADRKRPLSGVH